MGTPGSAEEDATLTMTSGNRRLTRTSRSTSSPLNADFAKCSFPSTSTSQTTGQCDIPWTPRHIPFPDIPQDSDLLFEFITFVFTSLAAAAQFLNLYRTVFWLPHSFTSHAMVIIIINIYESSYFFLYLVYFLQNFYLIEWHVVLFILIVLGRRLLYTLCSTAIKAVSPSRFLPVILRIIK